MVVNLSGDKVLNQRAAARWRAYGFQLIRECARHACKLLVHRTTDFGIVLHRPFLKTKGSDPSIISSQRWFPIGLITSFVLGFSKRWPE